MSNAAQSILAKTLGAKKNFKKTEFDFEGEKVYFCQPSRGELREINKKSTDAQGQFDFLAFQLWSVIMLTKDADGNRVFSDEHFDSFLSEPIGGWLDQFSEEALKVMSNADPKSPQDI